MCFSARRGSVPFSAALQLCLLHAFSVEGSRKVWWGFRVSRSSVAVDCDVDRSQVITRERPVGEASVRRGREMLGQARCLREDLPGEA